jgi:hypothetical protein
MNYQHNAGRRIFVHIVVKRIYRGSAPSSLCSNSYRAQDRESRLSSLMVRSKSAAKF